jgi:hypothetical protein
MARQSRPFSAVALSGDLAYIRLRITTPNEAEYDERLQSTLRELHDDLEGQVKRAVSEILGPDFEVSRIGVRKGSVSVLIVIATAYALVSQYKDFRESIKMLVSELAEVTRRLLRRTQIPQISVRGSWIPGPELISAESALSSIDREDAWKPLLWYLIASHAALLVVVIWVFVKWASSR